MTADKLYSFAWKCHPRNLLKRQNNYIVAILLLTLFVIGTVRYVQVTLSSIEESIPLKVVEDSQAMASILYDIHEVSHAIAIARLQTGAEREKILDVARNRLDHVRVLLNEKRVQYGFDNLIGTTARRFMICGSGFGMVLAGYRQRIMLFSQRLMAGRRRRC